MKKITIIILGLMIVLTCINTSWAGTANLQVIPNSVDIGSNFNGIDLTISGNMPMSSDVYIKISSPSDSVLELSKKGKVGFFWLNVENTVVSNVPKLYQIISSKPLSQVPPNLRNELGLNTDFSSVYSTGEVVKQSDSGSVRLSKKEADNYLKALVGIYKGNHLYDVKENAVIIKGDKFEAVAKLPPNIPQEKCNVTVYAIKDGKLISTVSTPFNVAGVGIVRWLSNEAIYSGPEYGFIAVLFALAFGAGVALFFGFIENLLNKGNPTGFSPGAGH